MQWQEVYNYNPLTSGEVYRNSKTKLFTDGTTNTIVSRSCIFKDKDILSEYMENEDQRKMFDLKMKRETHSEQIKQIYNILEMCIDKIIFVHT